jgi:opacity protein-like surface antigen
LLTNYIKDDYDITEQVDSIITRPPNYYHYYNFKVSVEYLHNLITFKNFSFILGGGPFISFSKDERSDMYTNPAYKAERLYKQKSTGFGLDIVVGAEYILTDNIIISGEYTFSVSKINFDIDDLEKYTSFDNPENNSLYHEKGKRNEFGFGGNYVNFGLAVFF